MITSIKGLNHNSIIVWGVALGLLLLNSLYYIYSVRSAELKVMRLENEYQAKRAVLKRDTDRPTENKQVPDIELAKWEDFTRVMSEVYNKAEQLDLALDSASYQHTNIKNTSIVKITISWPVEGSYEDIKRFIYYLETSPRSFIIENLSLGNKKGSGNGVSLQLSVAAYFKG